MNSINNLEKNTNNSNNSKKYNKYKRVILKISGETFSNKESTLSINNISRIADEIKSVALKKIEIGIVLGGGNIIRGARFPTEMIERVTCDYMGMLSTIINGLILRDILRAKGLKSQIITTRPIENIGELYSYEKVLEYLKNGYILIFSGGTSFPYFSTDTLAAVRSAELKVDCLLKATKVDGVYDKDPVNHKDAKKFEYIKYDDILINKYNIMDFTAISFCMENKIPIRVFNLNKKGNFLKIIQGQNIGTLIDDFK